MVPSDRRHDPDADADPDAVVSIIEDDSDAGHGASRSWRILVVDDDPEVHSTTRFVLHHAQILGRSLSLVHTHSAAETRQLLQDDRDFAVILLDVVMETEDAGLAIVAHIRNELGMDQVRIILRTGQPGYAPELEIVAKLDINDYRTKAELSHARLITSLTATLRSYDQIRTIAASRRGLELIVHASAELTDLHTLTDFAEGVLTQVAALLKAPLAGIICTHLGSPLDADDDGLYVLGSTGHMHHHIGLRLDAIGDARIIASIQRCIAERDHAFDVTAAIIFLNGGGRYAGAIFLEREDGLPLEIADQQLLEVFASNMSACFGNVTLVEQLDFVAYHDTLTRLVNRSGFVRALDEVAWKTGEQTVVALLDIQTFADLNDGLGQEAGNALLVAVAMRLRERLGDSCQLARIGADVFGLIGPEAMVNPEHLGSLLDQAFAAGEHLIPVNFSMGFCRLLEGNISGITLLKRASIALSRAKNDVLADIAYFMPEMEDDMHWRLDLVRRLRQDFQDRKLALWYQPQIELANGRVVGLEALLRWPDVKGFVQPPDVFIPLAEYSGLIVDIGDWALDTACAALMRLDALEGDRLQMAVNVSMPQFRSERFLQYVDDTLRQHRVPPQRLELEITESLAMDDPKIVVSSLNRVKAIGVRVAIDDFGTGYSSLAHLRDLPIDCLKIDRAFISEIVGGQGGMFAETIVALGKKLGVSIVAEGVETAEQAGFLRGMGCDIAQGYLYAKPMPLDDLIAWLVARGK